MRRSAILFLAGLTVAGCVGGPPPPARLPPDAFGGINLDNDIGAINLAQWAFADAARLRGDPVDAARAAAAVDYLADELDQSPRWVALSPIVKLQMQQARIEVRGALGIVPNAPSQAVTNGLLGAAAWLQAGNGAGALAALATPVFTLGPQATLARLTDLPFLRAANIATQRAALYRNFPGCPGCR